MNSFALVMRGSFNAGINSQSQEVVAGWTRHGLSGWEIRCFVDFAIAGPLPF